LADGAGEGEAGEILKPLKTLITIISLILLVACNDSKKILVKVTDQKNNYGYANLKGDIIIPFGKYTECFTDTFKKYAIVLKPKVGFIAIDRDEKVLFEVFPFDNGPDYPSEGLFRIVKNGKIGYADLNFSVKIQPQYGCAFPFENGVAKVSKECKSITDGEHSVWVSNNWIYIDKSGVRVKN